MTTLDRELQMTKLLIRLDDAFEHVCMAAAEDDDEELGRWEDLWMDLLLEYEALYDEGITPSTSQS